MTFPITIRAAVDDNSRRAESHPRPPGPRLRDLPELLGSLPALSDEEAAAFAEDVEKAHAESKAMPERLAWDDAD